MHIVTIDSLVKLNHIDNKCLQLLFVSLYKLHILDAAYSGMLSDAMLYNNQLFLCDDPFSPDLTADKLGIDRTQRHGAR